MSSVHHPALEGPMLYTCAQAGCQVCVERLLHQHAGLVHWVIRHDCCSALPYLELRYKNLLLRLGWVAISLCVGLGRPAQLDRMRLLC